MTHFRMQVSESVVLFHRLTKRVTKWYLQQDLSGHYLCTKGCMHKVNFAKESMKFKSIKKIKLEIKSLLFSLIQIVKRKKSLIVLFNNKAKLINCRNTLIKRNNLSETDFMHTQKFWKTSKRRKRSLLTTSERNKSSKLQHSPQV